MKEIRNRKFYIITIVIAMFYTFIFSRVLFPKVPEFYKMSYIDNKVDTYGTTDMYRYKLGEKIDVGFLSKNICPLSKGWSYLENDGVWSDGKESQICLYLNSTIKKDTICKLKILCLATGAIPEFKVSINEDKISSASFNENNETSFKINKHKLKKGYNFINFYWIRTYCPGVSGENDDGRELCIKLVSFTINEI